MKIDGGFFTLDLGGGLLPNTFVFTGPETPTETVRLAVLKRDVVFRPNVVVTMGDRFLAAGETLADYVADQQRALKAMRGFETRGEEPVTCADGGSGILVHHSFDNQQGLRIEQLQLYRTDERAIIVATATHLMGAPFAAAAESFKTTLRSLAMKL